MSKAVKWVGRVTICNCCNGDFGNTMYDARMPRIGVWGNFCQDCFDELGCSLGTGNGQKYTYEDATGDWIQVAG